MGEKRVREKAGPGKKIQAAQVIQERSLTDSESYSEHVGEVQMLFGRRPDLSYRAGRERKRISFRACTFSNDVA